jgi:hypothetical protein
MKNKKLTTAMINVLSKAINDIEKAKNLDYPEWLMSINSVYDYRPERFVHWEDREAAQKAMDTAKEKLEKAVAEEKLKNYWEEHRKNIALTYCNSGTLHALEDRGYIRIIKDSSGQKIGIDKVEVLKFEW